MVLQKILRLAGKTKSRMKLLEKFDGHVCVDSEISCRKAKLPCHALSAEASTERQNIGHEREIAICYSLSDK